DGNGGAPDLLRVMLHPAVGGIDLRQLQLRGRLRLAAGIEQDGARAGRTLIDGQYEARLPHDPPHIRFRMICPRLSRCQSTVYVLFRIREVGTMAQNSRQQQILDLVRQRGFMSIEALADHFSVTPQTIRRDINQLSDRELLQRYHGGARLPSSVENLAYQTRQVQCLEEKRRIAQLVARHVPNDASLFINIGTTTEEVAKALLNHRGLRIITNNLHVASIMSQNAGFEV